MFVITPNLAIYFIQTLLIISCIAPFSHSEVEFNITKVDIALATIFKDAESWSDVFSVPKEGHKIFNTMQPVPCPNLFRPSILIPASHLRRSCLPGWVTDKICPSHGKNYTMLEMGYTGYGDLKNVNGYEAAKSWILIMREYAKDVVWLGWYKLCSINVNGEPYLGVAMSAGFIFKGSQNTEDYSYDTHGQYYVSMCVN